jgi:glycosyltransferase 2 family protein
MKKSVKNIIQVLLGFVIGGYLLFITLKEQNFDEIVNSIRETDIVWALMGGVSLLAVFLLRAYRWKIILNNSGIYPKTFDVINSIALGYFINLFTPKFGELVRCTNLKRTDNVKVSKVLGTVVSERVWDILVLILGLIFVILFEFDRIASLFNIQETFAGFKNSTLLFAVILIALGALFLLSYKLLYKRINHWKAVVYLANFVKEIYTTVLLTFKIKKYKQFLLLTLFIWIALVSMNYCFLMSLHETDSSSIYFAVIVLFIGAIGWVIPTPAGVGSTHYFILQLFLAFELSRSAGIHFGILSNGLNFVYTLVVGIVALIYNEIRVFRIKKLQDINPEPIEE